MGQVKTWRLPEHSLEVDFVGGITTLYNHDPIYIGAPSRLRIIFETKSAVNLSQLNANCAAPSIMLLGGIDNKSDALYYAILADPLLPDPTIQGTVGEVLQFTRVDKYLTIPPINDPLLWPYLKVRMILGQNSPTCVFASIKYSITIIADYD